MVGGRDSSEVHITYILLLLVVMSYKSTTKEVTQKIQSLNLQSATTTDFDRCYNFSVGNDRTQEFFSPNFPNNYPNSTDCERIIRAPYGHSIKLEFRDQFHLEEATNCEYDFLEIRDGAYGYANLIKKLCGHDFPDDLYSTGQYLFLRFKSDDSIEYSGFRAVYSYKQLETPLPQPPKDCRFNLTGPSGQIVESDIPADLGNYSYEHNIPIDCMWNITIQADHKMYINFKQFKLRYPNTCEANHIEIYESKLSETNRKSQFCGTQAEPYRSEGNNVNIHFFAKPDGLKDLKIDILYTAIRELTSPKESCYPNEFNCEDLTCIDITLKCNKVDNCKYRNDEAMSLNCDEESKGLLSLTQQRSMIIIFIVFFALVLGMCASITISCWSKIQERRQRKQDYKLRRSRETSMEMGLDRTMTITSLDRHEHEIAVQSSGLGSVPRTRKVITTANTINRKGFRDHEENNGCYVPDVDLNVFRKQPNGGPTALLEDKFSPETPPHLIGDALPQDCTYYHLHQYQPQRDQYQQQREQYQPQRDSIRSGSESPIPPPPPPPVLSHMRTRQRTIPLDASKLDTSSPDDNHHMVASQQLHHPDCAQHNSNVDTYSLRTKPEYSRSSSVPLGPHVSVIDDSEQTNDEEQEEYCDDDKIVPLNPRPITHRFRAEAVIEMGSGPIIGTSHNRQRSFETTRSAPDVVIMR